MNYPDSHPLHDRDAEWIAARAEHVASFNTHLMTESHAAMAHEYRRLIAKFNGSSAIDVSLLNEKARNRIRWLEDEVAKKASTPPSDWLTRAITLSGAPEDSDWAGLLEHVGGHESKMRRAESKYETLNGIRGAVLRRAEISEGMLAVRDGEVRKLRERAEAAESERDRWQEIAHRDHKTRCNKYRERAEAAEALAAEMKAKSSAAHAKIFMLETTANLTSSKTATPTQTDLSRIAADVSRMVVALEKMVPSA